MCFALATFAWLTLYIDQFQNLEVTFLDVFSLGTWFFSVINQLVPLCCDTHPHHTLTPSLQYLQIYNSFKTNCLNLFWSAFSSIVFWAAAISFRAAASLDSPSCSAFEHIRMERSDKIIVVYSYVHRSTKKNIISYTIKGIAYYTEHVRNTRNCLFLCMSRF